MKLLKAKMDFKYKFKFINPMNIQKPKFYIYKKVINI